MSSPYHLVATVGLDPTSLTRVAWALARAGHTPAVLVRDPDQLARNLARKLLTYATGRRPNYAERDEIKQLVEANLAKGGDKGFRDLFLELIASKTFRKR